MLGLGAITKHQHSPCPGGSPVGTTTVKSYHNLDVGPAQQEVQNIEVDKGIERKT